jgi:hypothetical protein
MYLLRDKLFTHRQSFVGHIAYAHPNITVRRTYHNCLDYLRSEADRQKHMEEKHQPSEKENKLKKTYFNKQSMKKIQRFKRYFIGQGRCTRNGIPQ